MSIADKLKKFDTVSYGVVVSIILLAVGFFVSFLVKTMGTDLTLSNYFNFLTYDNPERMDILIFSMIPNMFLFYFTNFQWQMYNFIKGLVGISVIFCLAIVFMSV